MPSAYSATTKNDLLLDSGMVYIGSGTPVPFAMTRGGVRFDRGEEWRTVAGDGFRSDVAGLRRITGRRPTITATFLDLSPAKRLTLMPGATSVLAGGVTTITPANAGGFLTPLSFVRAVFAKGNGGLYEFRLLRAFPEVQETAGGDNDEVGTTVVFHGELPWDGTTYTTDSSPFVEVDYPSGTPIATL